MVGPTLAVMDTNRLGPVEAVSRLGLGLAALGRPGYINVGHEIDLAGRTDPESLEAQTLSWS